jgi:hypothetical protein
MRIWTLHPRYLDPKGLVAAWREALLAQKVLTGGTRGYRNHPQLLRFRAADDPQAAIGAYLHQLAIEAECRGYKFDVRKISEIRTAQHIHETRGQLDYEWAHLKQKLRVRAPALARQFRVIVKPEPHPLFRIVAGGIREWEKQPDNVRNSLPKPVTRRGSPLNPARLL